MKQVGSNKTEKFSGNVYTQFKKIRITGGTLQVTFKC